MEGWEEVTLAYVYMEGWEEVTCKYVEGWEGLHVHIWRGGKGNGRAYMYMYVPRT